MKDTFDAWNGLKKASARTSLAKYEPILQEAGARQTSPYTWVLGDYQFYPTKGFAMHRETYEKISIEKALKMVRAKPEPEDILAEPMLDEEHQRPKDVYDSVIQRLKDRHFYGLATIFDRGLRPYEISVDEFNALRQMKWLLDNTEKEPTNA